MQNKEKKKDIRWIVREGNHEQAEQMAREKNLPVLVCEVLCARGITDADEAVRFMETNLSRIEDAFALKDMDKAVAVLRDALEKNEKIVVYGDYDCDGVTATAVMMRYLRSVGADCSYYIPGRLDEGYGMHCDSLRMLAQAGTQLIVTVDNGITALEEVRFAHELGMRIIVTDHHQCLGELPDADAVIDPQRPDDSPAFRALAGVGVACKFVAAMMGKDGKSDMPAVMERWAELAALGTVADLMTLTGENRAIVNYGVRRIATTGITGLRELCRSADLLGADKKPITTETLSHILGPRINAAGRMGESGKAEELLLTDDPAEAERIAAELQTHNQDRRDEESKIYAEAVELLEQDPERRDRPVIVLGHEGWHHGVIGIVASRLTEKYGRPVVLLVFEEERAKGSGRGIRGFNIFAAFTNAADCVLQFGGHEQAGGVTLERSRMPEFEAKLMEYAEAHPVDDTPVLEIDCELKPEQLTLRDVRDLKQLEPYGQENRCPMFCIRDMRINEMPVMGGGKHMRLLLQKDDVVLEAVWFSHTPDGIGMTVGDHVDIAFAAEINDFRGQRVQLQTKDIRWSEEELREDAEGISAYLAYLKTGSADDSQKRLLKPERSQFIAVWKFLQNACAGSQSWSGPDTVLYRRVRGAGTPLTLGQLHIILETFRELELIVVWRQNGNLDIRLGTWHKVSLEDAPVMKGLA